MITTQWLLTVGGGVLLGLSTGVLSLTLGRTSGISGIAAPLLSPKRGDVSWRLSFLAGLGAAGAVAAGFVPAALPAAPVGSGWVYLAAGTLVGFGASRANGCTSGHGVCGVGRLSRRSLVAMTLFTVFAMTTRQIVRSLAGGA